MTRSKSLPIRSSRKSLDPYHPSPASLPEEANQGVSNKRYPPQIEIGDDDVEIVTDTFDGRDKKRHCVGTSEPLSLEACIVCETSDELVYRCCGADCLLWFHDECLKAEFGSEDPANPFCPYCWFQILAVESIRLKEKAVGAEMAVFKYLDKEMRSKGQEDSVDTTDIVSDQEVEVDEKCSDESRGEDMAALVEETDQSEGEKENFEVCTDRVVDEEERVVTENFLDDEDDEAAGDQTRGNADAGKERDVSPFLSMQESFSGKEHDQVQQSEKRRRKRRLILNAFDSDVSSNGSTNEPNGEDAVENITSLALVVTSPPGMMKNHQREDSRTTKVDNSKTVRLDIPIFKMDQKRRLLWTPEEEYMLKVGVEKFSAEAKKNIPWRKILEMGQKVFHETRTPSDLKDKWRNMTGARLKNKQDSTTVPGM
ncbi:hypothetical protein HID58_031829 [Brassica napus]|uniref:Myb-like domain-containing protein n=1 Tax=Brassica napus TaxID=3708 RepID=A0ABQ8BUR9_BRANA|nr:hypothetical protein HID58_031829 [Brassica napus]